MKRVKLVVAYDGSTYHGWQIQPGASTIEGELNKALSELLQEEIQVIGASRTDSGVHALCNVAVFDTKSRIPAEKISYALNQRLPEDIRIQESVEVEADFHPRHCNSRKTYEYRILNRPFPLPTKRLYAHFTYVPMNIEMMQAAADYLVGEHDFKSFCGNPKMKKSTVRLVDSITIEQNRDRIHFTFHGTGFLQNMVRILVGTLLEVGRGYWDVDYVQTILEAKDRKLAGPTAPPEGLCLMKVDY